VKGIGTNLAQIMRTTIKVEQRSANIERINSHAKEFPILCERKALFFLILARNFPFLFGAAMRKESRTPKRS
jgi:hypothetical protein